MIIYTTQYREGSEMFARAAKTLEQELSGTNKEVICKGILSKKELNGIFESIADGNQTIDEYHFVGHSGMYGPMYGTRDYPEQYSPHEVQELKIPFAPDARAYFHCCRSARWYFVDDRSYDRVAALYDQVFQDIKVRKDEWKWLSKHLPLSKAITLLDIGCGNGALLKELSPHIHCGIGVDVSMNILNKARLLNKENKNLDFRQLKGPSLPLDDHSIDVVTSLLSFRYLDWDPLMNEIKRVLKPGGKLLIIDMVTVPVKKIEIPRFLSHKVRQFFQRYRDREFYANLKKLVNDPDWQFMLKYNPIRAEHEMKWYLESRFPGKKVEKINIGYHSSMLAFDSGNIENMNDIYLTYP